VHNAAEVRLHYSVVGAIFYTISWPALVPVMMMMLRLVVIMGDKEGRMFPLVC